MKRETIGTIAAAALAGILAASPALADDHGNEKKKNPAAMADDQGKGKKKHAGHCEAKSCKGSVKLGKRIAKNDCGGHAACPGKDGKNGSKDDPWNRSPKHCKKAGGKWKKS